MISSHSVYLWFGESIKINEHYGDCYFGFVKTSGYNKKNKRKIEYPSEPSAIRPVPHSVEIPVPVFARLPCLEVVGYDQLLSDCNDADFEIEQESVRKTFDQHELIDFARDLELSKKTSEIRE